MSDRPLHEIQAEAAARAEARAFTKAEAGRLGAAKRWAGHDLKAVPLSGLTAEQKRLVLALIAAARSTPDGPPRTA